MKVVVVVVFSQYFQKNLSLSLLLTVMTMLPFLYIYSVPSNSEKEEDVVGLLLLYVV